MLFYPADASVPEKLCTEEFLLRPLMPADNELDYAAVMATQETLRLHGAWPRPGFTPEENLADLEGHAADFLARTGFTYTILQMDGTRCLGCVYLYPLAGELRRHGADDETVANVGDFEAEVWFWVRPDAVAADLDRRLLAVLLPWIRDDFAFARVVFYTSASDERQESLLRDAGLRLIWSHPARDTQVLHFA
jgi:hypothetical protein